jgi:hypothetical protein
MKDERGTVPAFRTDVFSSTDVAGLPHRRATIFRRLHGEGMIYTDGVRLVCAGAPVLEELRALEASGVRLILCSTCLGPLACASRCR